MSKLRNLLKPTDGDLNAIRVLLVLGAVLIFVSVIFDVTGFGWSGSKAEDSGWLGGFEFVTDGGGDGISVDIDPEEYAKATNNSAVTINAIEATVPTTGAARVLDIIGSLLTGLGIGSTMATAYVILTRAVKGRLFERSSVPLLVLASLTMIVAQLGEVLNSFARMEALSDLDLVPTTRVSFAYAIVALVFGALARAWSVGADLAEETELTV